MATILRLKNTQFKNNDLPVTAPMIRDGLVGAWRFANSEKSYIDLSGNGRQLSPVNGGPIDITSEGIVTDLEQGLVTDLTETPAITLCAVYKIDTSMGTSGAMILGNYYSGAGEHGGVSLYSNVSIDQFGAASQSHWYNISTSQNANSSYTTIYRPVGEYIFICQTINTETNTQKTFVPRFNESRVVERDPTEGIYGDRNPSAGNIHIGCAYPPSVWGTNNTPYSQATVSEALVFDRALTDEEAYQQYHLSRSFMARVRNISI